MILRALIIFLILIQIDAFGQQDSIWNVMILKKNNKPEVNDNMAEFSPTGFYLYRNCFYDLQFKDKTKRTLRLIDIKPDTLIFIGISLKKDTNLNLPAKDSFLIEYKSIDKLLLIKDFGAKTSKKINFNEYFFIFYKSLLNNRLESKYDYVFSGGVSKSELIPRLSSFGITYNFEYGGKLYYHSGINVPVPKYSDEEKVKALKGIMTVLNLLINKQLNVTIQ
jgi:hypothetical protein